jgi:hypothetical protein
MYVLSTWKIVPGTQMGGEFDPGAFTKWLSQTEKIVSASGHYDVAMIQLGNVLCQCSLWLSFWVNCMDSPGVINTCTVSIAKVGAFFAIHSFGNQITCTRTVKSVARSSL